MPPLIPRLMDDDFNMNDYVVPLSGGATAAAKKHTAAPRHGGAEKNSDWMTGLLIAAVVVLVLVIGFLMWRRRYRSRPDCASEKGSSQQACTALSSVCAGDAACLNAVAHCMPVINDANSASASVGGRGVPMSAVDPKALRSCARAISNVDPVFMAGLAKKFGGPQACVPPVVAEALANPAEYQAALGVAGAVAALAPYSVKVAKNLPACHGQK